MPQEWAELRTCPHGPHFPWVPARFRHMLFRERVFRHFAVLQASARASPVTPSPLEEGEPSDRETSGRAAVTAPADAYGQRQVALRTRKLSNSPDRGAKTAGEGLKSVPENGLTVPVSPDLGKRHAHGQRKCAM